jgi:hypothetical protein
MKIFLSWSGPRSRAIAEALNDWLRRVIQAVKPFYSPEIEKGAKWSGEIDNALEGTSFGIICLTPDNLNSTWIHFEAGALSKTKDATIWTFLYGLTPGDVPQPLGKFQHTVAEKADTLRLLKTINKRLGEVGGESLTDRLLEENFEMFWPQLDSKLAAATPIEDLASAKKLASSLESQRDSREILNEILELARNQERRLGDLEERVYRPLQPLPSRKKNHLMGLLTIRVPAEGVDDVAQVGRDLGEALGKIIGAPTSTAIGSDGVTIETYLNARLTSEEIRLLLKEAGRRARYVVTDWDFVPSRIVPIRTVPVGS